MYKLNDIPLSDYGIYPSRANGSNLALSGFLDMPKRLGKTFHSWGDTYGVEAYVDADEMFFGGRTITFNGMVKANDRTDALAKLQTFYTAVANFNDLVVFESNWSSHEIYIKEAIQVEYMGNGWALLVLKMQEPMLSYDTKIVTSEGDPIIDSDNDNILFNDAILTGTAQGIYTVDGFRFSDFGAFVQQSNDLLSASETKEALFINDTSEGYQLTKRTADEIGLSLVFRAISFGGLKSNLNAFTSLFMNAGVRTLNVDGYERQCFAVQGAQVTNIKVLEGISIAELQIKLLMAAPILQTSNRTLTSEGDTILTNETDVLIYN